MANPLTATVDVLKALGHPVRLRILAMLRGGELCVCQMTAVLGLAEADARVLRELRRVPVEELCRVDLDLHRLGIKRQPAAPGR